ncbi:zinc-binding dehydrogenase [Streptomyces sp. NBC_01429]|uniref:zinc-binding dehydrogenase n=1 Tax=Streptomyces sp. NBC_01429 TaxID=2903862 RepID=UPI002E27B2FD|nr:zinc-binding dehydrogenase [Streptomyces sp. NBC_01429]
MALSGLVNSPGIYRGGGGRKGSGRGQEKGEWAGTGEKGSGREPRRTQLPGKSEGGGRRPVRAGAGPGPRAVRHGCGPDAPRSRGSPPPGRATDLVVEIGGAGTISQSIAAVAHGGRISLVGNLASGGGMDLTRFFQRGATLRTITVGSRSDFEQMNRAISQIRLRPVIDRVFPFKETPDAFSYLEKGARFGKVVISH